MWVIHVLFLVLIILNKWPGNVVASQRARDPIAASILNFFFFLLGVTMDLFLKFIQGCPGPLQDGTLRLKFHKTAKETFPSVDACFVVLTLPICHESYASFEETMSKAIRFGCQGYGKV